MRPERQEVPGPQHRRQTAGPPPLQHVDHRDDHQHDNQRDAHPHQRLPPGQGEGEDGKWQDEEAGEDVDTGEPAVGGGDVTQGFGQADGDAGERDRVPEDDAGDVEQEVDQGDLCKEPRQYIDGWLAGRCRQTD